MRVGGGKNEVASSIRVGMRDRLETVFCVSTLKDEVGVQKRARLELPSVHTGSRSCSLTQTLWVLADDTCLCRGRST